MNTCENSSEKKFRSEARSEAEKMWLEKDILKWSWSQKWSWKNRCLKKISKWSWSEAGKNTLRKKISKWSEARVLRKKFQSEASFTSAPPLTTRTHHTLNMRANAFLVAIYTHARHNAPLHVYIVNTMNWTCQNKSDTSATTTAKQLWQTTISTVTQHSWPTVERTDMKQ